MSAVVLDGDALAADQRRELALRAAALRRRGIAPRLLTILVGDDPDSAVYVARKHADGREVGVEVDDVRLPAAVTAAGLSARIADANRDPRVHGVLVQLPLPAHLDAAAAVAAVDPSKDADGLHPLNLGRLVAGAAGPRPCTPQAVIGLLQRHGVALAGRRVAVIGRGALVGRPLALMLGASPLDAVVTVLHRAAPELAAVLLESDVVIAAAGAPGLVTAAMIRPGAAVLGVGASRRGGVLVSDVAEDVALKAGFVTPPHGSVGPLTRAQLLRNVLDLAEARSAPDGRGAGTH